MVWYSAISGKSPPGYFKDSGRALGRLSCATQQPQPGRSGARMRESE